jgi:hypothetical protein
METRGSPDTSEFQRLLFVQMKNKKKTKNEGEKAVNDMHSFSFVGC